jgi:hypothetical protein
MALTYPVLPWEGSKAIARMKGGHGQIEPLELSVYALVVTECEVFMLTNFIQVLSVCNLF